MTIGEPLHLGDVLDEGEASLPADLAGMVNEELGSRDFYILLLLTDRRKAGGRPVGETGC